MSTRIRTIILLFILCGWLARAPLLRADDVAWVAFGDSITVGLGASTPRHSYIGHLQRVLGPIDNAAMSATTLAQQLPLMEAYAGSAAHVLWLTGYNDMRAGTDLTTYQELLDRALSTLTTRGKTVYLGLCLPMTTAGWRWWAWERRKRRSAPRRGVVTGRTPGWRRGWEGLARLL